MKDGSLRAGDINAFLDISAHTTASVPLASTAAACGFPSPADDYMDRPLDFNELLVNNPDATFAVRISGESMRDRGLLPGDIAVVDRSRSAVSGCIVFGLVGSEFTIKTYRLKAGGGLVLEAANPDFPDIAIVEASAFEVWGVVTGIIRTL
jgi:DNA polymerase V